jgi:hypothetical protein
MRFRSAIYLSFSLVVFSFLIAEGQSSRAEHKVNVEIPEVALLGLVSEESGGINLMPVAPGEAGDPINLSDVQQNKGIWINYSSIIRSQNHRRKVVAAIQGEIPAGLRLVVEAKAATGGGGGKLGTPAGKVYLSTEPTEVISNIGSCFTGRGVNNGHLLTYRLEAGSEIENFENPAQTQAALQVIYTLTDHN